MDLSMNLQNAFGSIATFTMLILLIHEPLLTSSFFLLEIKVLSYKHFVLPI